MKRNPPPEPSNWDELIEDVQIALVDLKAIQDDIASLRRILKANLIARIKQARRQYEKERKHDPKPAA